MATFIETERARIQQLSSSVITKIAAGEVIERPASVVKELLENSIDAGSTRIDIEVEQGGAELIRIVDNGCGILPDDFHLAFANHATSKLSCADDLFSVHTMGFRGEALSSIGGVAQVALQSRARDLDCGAEITCQGGEFSDIKAWNGAPGTRIEVRHLFFNTPVRRKFLRTASTEMGHISEHFTRVALAQPGLHLTLKHNGKEVYEVPSSAGLLDRIQLFFGKDVADKLYQVDVEHGPARLFGYIADPSCNRGNAKLQYLFLNGRWIRDRSLGHAVQEAYRGLLMTARYAVAFLFLELPPDQVDVNVHPTKSEVRFRDGNALYSFFLSNLRGRLREENLTPQLRPPASADTQAYFQPRLGESSGSLYSQTGFPSFTKVTPTTAGSSPETTPAATAGSSLLQNTQAEPEANSTLQDAMTQEIAGPTSDAASFPTADTIPPAEKETFTSLPGSARGEPQALSPTQPPARLAADLANAIQVHNTYLVVETPEGMLVIDQHALHERVLFEQLKERLRTGTLETQPLLIPEPVDLSAEQASQVLEHRDALRELGMSLEDFGGGTVLVSSYPAILGRRSPAHILKSIVDHLAVKDRPPTREQFLSHLMSLMACHAAVRSGDPLTPEEINALLAMRHLAHDTHHCPHGRPTSLLFSRQELDRQFRRI